MKNSGTAWFVVNNVGEIDSPALLIYKSRMNENIRLAIEMIGDARRLRPHIKTSKIAEVCRIMMEEGIEDFKCATIAEAEMLGSIGAKDVLIAYPVNGPKAERFIRLIKKYPRTIYSCLIDNLASSSYLSQKANEENIVLHVFIDLNTGMNRTGIPVEEAEGLYLEAGKLTGITVKGFHAYDGHIHDTDLSIRQQKSNAAFAKIEDLRGRISADIQIVIGGSPTFTTHLKRNGVQCSPGTFVFWDHGYKTTITEQPFNYAALVMTRVVSVLDDHHVTIDLGYKSVACENPQPRVFFLNDQDATPLSQSEEHLVLKVRDASQYQPGDVLYGAPMHICPTVALYERAYVIEDNECVDEWKVVARDRIITI